MADEQQQPAPVGFPRRVGVIPNPAGLIEVRIEYQGAMIGYVLTIEEARTMAEILPKCADEAVRLKVEADAAAAAAAVPPAADAAA